MSTWQQWLGPSFCPRHRATPRTSGDLTSRCSRMARGCTRTIGLPSPLPPPPLPLYARSAHPSARSRLWRGVRRHRAGAHGHGPPPRGAGQAGAGHQRGQQCARACCLHSAPPPVHRVYRAREAQPEGTNQVVVDANGSYHFM